jgi:hypothetical protein
LRTRSTPAVTEILVHSWVVKPGAETVISKFPGDRSGTLYRPAELDVAVLAKPVLTSFTEMRTSGMAAPDSPATVPEIDPPVTCAFTGRQKISTEARVMMANFTRTPSWFKRNTFRVLCKN